MDTQKIIENLKKQVRIKDLYLMELDLPEVWSQERHEKFIRLKTEEKILESELISLESTPDDKQGENINYYQTRDLTDEEWLKLPKEEILQLYKNCYKMLNDRIASQRKLTDEEIDDQFLLTYFTGAVEVDDISAKHKRTGAKWARDQIQPSQREDKE
jgi:hypothetical protein